MQWKITDVSIIALNQCRTVGWWAYLGNKKLTWMFRWIHRNEINKLTYSQCQIHSKLKVKKEKISLMAVIASITLKGLFLLTDRVYDRDNRTHILVATCLVPTSCDDKIFLISRCVVLYVLCDVCVLYFLSPAPPFCPPPLNLIWRQYLVLVPHYPGVIRSPALTPGAPVLEGRGGCGCLPSPLKYRVRRWILL